MVKNVFSLIFDGVRNNKDNIKNKTLSSKKKKEVITIY